MQHNAAFSLTRLMVLRSLSRVRCAGLRPPLTAPTGRSSTHPTHSNFKRGKKVENHAHSVAIHFMHYNFVRIHQSLRVTPAMAAGVTTKLWDLVDMVWVIEDWEARRDGTLLVG